MSYWRAFGFVLAFWALLFALHGNRPFRVAGEHFEMKRQLDTAALKRLGLK